MNTLNRAAIVSAALAVTISVPAGTAAAQGNPAPTPAAVSTSISTDVAPGVHYTGDTADNSALIQTVFGTLTTRGAQFQVLDNQSHLVAGNPLTLQSDPATWPNAAKPTAATSPAAPTRPAAANAPGLPIHHVDATSDFNDALSVASTQFGLAATVGTMAGSGIGLVAGCPLGAVTFGLTGIVTGPIDPLIAGLGCVVGAATGAGLGGVLGGLILGVPVGVASGVQMYNTLHSQGHI
ncbi:hypothetical protein FOS14_21175 [Skermania sp. ID1734]|uniref:hypothetical protein n=1 Tax=Skermania sp. ID1734 TaxID=2597516 RepID=UPI00117D7432|nr:hypothetical protein [Skermania sp. ID1734]TSD94269.1 hypothetical protein FOS14_21175 [Skermania sp. ID1734]